MKNLKSILGVMLIAILAFTFTSCRDAKKEEDDAMDHDDMEMEHDDMEMNDSSMNSSDNMAMGQDKSASDAIVANYLELKNALVADNTEAAAISGKKVVGAFKAFDVKSYSEEEQKELNDIIENAREQAEHISENNGKMDHQREHFEILSKDVIDLIAITGTDKKLYQDFCPMYNDGKGAMWLSEVKEIKNPFYGSKMLTCGSIQKEI